jgi:hypothetical protein
MSLPKQPSELFYSRKFYHLAKNLAQKYEIELPSEEE